MSLSLPSGWERRKARDCMDVRDGTHDSPKYIAAGYPLVTSKNLVNGQIDFSTCSFISKEDFDAISKRSAVDNGDILYAMIGTIGNPVIVQTQSEFAIKNVALFKFNNKNVFNRYFFHYLNSELAINQFNNISRGGTQKFVSLNNIRDLEIPLPPLAEQQKIAAILDAADSLRQKDQQLVERYTALSQSLFLEMFGDPVTNPMGWKIKTLAEFIRNLDTGVSVNSTDVNYKDTQIGILKTSCVYSGIFSPEQAKVIRDDELERAKLNPKADSIIISRMNTPELVGKSAYINHDFPMLFLPDRLWQTEKSSLNYSVRWLATAIAFNSFMKEISKIASGTSGSMKNISKGKFLSLPMTYPSPALQNQFAERVQLIEAQKQQAQLSLAKSEDLFSSLLQRAFTGELTAKIAA